MKDVYIKRRSDLIKEMKDNSALFLLAEKVKQSTNDQNFKFSQNRNYYYLLGIDLPNQIYCATKINDIVKEYLFVERPDKWFEMYHGPMTTDQEYKEITGIENVFYLDRFDWHMSRIFDRNNLEKLYMDYHKRDLDGVTYSENDLTEKLKYAHPYLKVKNISHVICNMRRIKSSEEVSLIQKAVDITDLGIKAILNKVGDGVNEKILQAEFEYQLTANGANGNAFSPIIASGKNTVFLHYDINNKDLKDGELLLVDLGAEFEYYAADISRTFPVSGKFTDLQKKYYSAVLYAQDKVIESLRPGLDIDETLTIARDAIYEKCLEYGLCKNREEINDYLPHGICHYIGLDTHDVGDRNILKPGMVTTIEPGIYIPELGIGIRIEDDALITEDGCELLSKNIIRTVEDIEEFFSKR